jgi:hypothetical protein
LPLGGVLVVECFLDGGDERASGEAEQDAGGEDEVAVVCLGGVVDAGRYPGLGKAWGERSSGGDLLGPDGAGVGELYGRGGGPVIGVGGGNVVLQAHISRARASEEQVRERDLGDGAVGGDGEGAGFDEKIGGRRPLAEVRVGVPGPRGPPPAQEGEQRVTAMVPRWLSCMRVRA